MSSRADDGGARPGAGRRIYTVSADRPFLTALAEALLAGNLPVAGGRVPDPWQLADLTLMLPTRRATRALQEAFLKAASGRALLLPRIKTIFAAEEDQALLASVEDLAADGGVDSKPAISEIERQLALTELVLRWSAAELRDADQEIGPHRGAAARTPAQAAKLARELARLMDQMEIEDVDFARMRTLVPENFSEHWARTLDFLKIVTEYWPAHLAERGVVSPMLRSKQRILEQARRLQASPPGAPVIVAGVMSSVPAVTQFLDVVTRLPNGALVLPALDETLDEASWAEVSKHPEHPQFGIKKLLDALGVTRADVAPLPGGAEAPAQRARAALVSEVMRPVGTTDRWHQFTAGADRKAMARALEGVTMLDAASAEEEAEAIALMLREVADVPGRTAALVTPDRLLARRVSTRLESWGLWVDDTAGVPFARTAVGAFLALVADAAAKGFEPVAMMALLKHPFSRLRMPVGELRRGRRALELGVFRAPYLGRDLAGVASALDRAEAAAGPGSRRPSVRLNPADWKAARDLVRRLQKAYAPTTALFAKSAKVSLAELAAAHVATAEALTRSVDEAAETTLWRGEAGDVASRLFAGLHDGTMLSPDMQAADYPEFYRGLVAGETIRPRGTTHPRIGIWEPYESRLQQPDIVILGSLNEGTWPHAADPGPWLNRPMRQALGMPAPEERIGDSAHIFTSLLGAERVYLTRAAKSDGVPMVPSRWLLRLQALVAGLGLKLDADKRWLAWAQARNAIEGAARPVQAPEPRPKLALRPRQLSVTTIETWIANPYAVYAQRILGLQPLPALGMQPDAALRGSVVHDALSRFAQRFPTTLPANAEEVLVELAREALAELTGNARVAAFWAPRFGRFANWFAETEKARREGVSQVLAEVAGAKVLEGPAGPFTLKARADRIDFGAQGLIITDYKTASASSLKLLASRAEQGRAPQLSLEAVIAAVGGFANVPLGQVAKLRYISASGGEPPGHEQLVNGRDATSLARDAEAGLVRLIAEFDRESTPYKAVRRARFTYDYDDYAHLARVAEWSAEMPEDS